MQIRSLRAPRLRTASQEESHRAATWLELFYDLAFVVAVGQLGHRLAVDHGAVGVWTFIALFVPLWWTWASFTFYADRYDTDDLGQRLLAVGQMISIILMAASIGREDSLTAFAVAFVLAWIVLLAMYWRAYRHVEATRELVRGYLQGFSVGLGFWIVSIWVPGPAKYVLWAIGLLIHFYTPWRVREIQKNVPLSISHIPERFGLFTILVLGESLVAIVGALSHGDWEAGLTIGGILGVMVASGIWWLYFDNAEGRVVRRREGQPKAWQPTVWLFSHLPLVIAITAMGIGLEFIVAQEVDSTGRWLMGGGIAAALAAMALLAFATDRGHDDLDKKQAYARIGSAVVVLLITAVSASWGANVFLAALLIVAAAQIAYDIMIGMSAAAE
ncbi:MAG: low temperature requirement protein A [bacterium]|nr:low temperature requirement protein A [bacterium]